MKKLNWLCSAVALGGLLAIAMPARAQEDTKPAAAEEKTLTELPGAETMIYRDATDGGEPMRLFVYKPDGWKASDQRPVLVYFFGGGWTKGTPEKSYSWARWAAKQGMVGIAPDYRTKNRFGTSPLASVADGRASVRWIQDHAKELGIDPKRIAVGGNSAGGHVALWTALSTTPPGSDEAEAPLYQPAALFLSSAVSDTSASTGYTPKRFGDDAEALSPVHHLDAKMPPTVIIHGDADPLVNFSTAEKLRDELKQRGTNVTFAPVPGGSHGYTTDFPEWKDKQRELMEKLLKDAKLLPVEQSASR